jgi:hypothetical protein
MSQVYSLTFAESIENHKGMEIIGDIASEGFSIEECENLASRYNGECILLNTDLLDQDPALLVIFRDGLKTIFDIDKLDLFNEQNALEKDSKCLMYGRVVNKKARHNLCFADFEQTPDYEAGKGTVYNFQSQPILSSLRKGLGDKFGPSFENLYAEGNYYYDVKSTYIGFHGDTERKKVLCCRLGEDFPIHFQWYYKSEAQGEVMSFDLSGGDIYIMSDKAVGHDWKKKNIPTLRHAAGHWNVLKKYSIKK